MTNSYSFSAKTAFPKVQLYDLHPAQGDLQLQVLQGLQQPEKFLPAKLLYDKRGAELFDAICELEEYYLTRTEISILQTYAAEIASCIRGGALVEFGSGSSQKIKILLDALSPLPTYVALDISKQHLVESCEKLVAEYPTLEAIAICADYNQPFEFPNHPSLHHKHKIAFFPGSTVGNLEPAEVIQFLKQTAELIGAEGGLLIGVDLKKDKAILEPAYDDAQGVSAAFALNVLNHLNRVLQADFQLDQFQYQALYNESLGRIEMYLVSLVEQVIQIGDSEVSFAAGEQLRTEHSYKYTVDEFHQLAIAAGFYPKQVWLDPKQFFSIHYLAL
jgi:dimethylhistidine N-methyltransferase